MKDRDFVFADRCSVCKGMDADLFDFDGDLYGQRIEVEFVAKLRDELRFDDLDALKSQMDRDAAQARAILGMHEHRRGAMA